MTGGHSSADTKAVNRDQICKVNICFAITDSLLLLLLVAVIEGQPVGGANK